MKHVFLARGSARAEQIAHVQTLLRALPSDKKFRVEIHEQRGTRSEQQNAYLWSAVYPSILKQGGERLAGFEDEDLHEWFLEECFGFVVLNAFGRKRRKAAKRSSRLNKVEFANFIEWIQRKMAGMGIVVPDPDPEWYLKEAS